VEDKPRRHSFTDISERIRHEKEREGLIAHLRRALSDNKVLNGLLPICAGCKKIRADKRHWTQLERYISSHTAAQFSNGLCPDCVWKHCPDITEQI